jgi:light-harvesting protein B-800-850 alpha chain
MNQGRIWCVVNPTIGLPAFLGSVALISFTVHFAVIENTTWVKRFFNGAEAAAPAAEAPKTAMNAVLHTPARAPAQTGG